MNQQPIKRKNPFDIRIEDETINEEKKETVSENYVDEETFINDVVPQRTQTQKKQPRVVQKQTYYEPLEVEREKYTSTMDVALRRRIKVVCAQRGIMFAKFVEDACREKLSKEGNR